MGRKKDGNKNAWKNVRKDLVMCFWHSKIALGEVDYQKNYILDPVDFNNFFKINNCNRWSRLIKNL